MSPSFRSLTAPAVIIAVGLLVFAPYLSRVGFYLDDWATLAYLHFAPHKDNFLGLLGDYLINDGRVLIRPVEVLHYGSIFWFAGTSPFLYHAVALAFEIVGALILYAVFQKLTGRRDLALLGALYTLLHPGHDSVRYWVICSSQSLSMLLLYVTIYGALKGAEPGKKQAASFTWYALAAFAYLVGLLNYETTLPLIATATLCLFFVGYFHATVQSTQARFLHGIKAALPVTLLGGGMVAAMLVYQKVIVPALGKGYAHAMAFKPDLMLKTIGTGIYINLPGPALEFFNDQAAHALQDISSSERVRLVLVAIVCLLGLVSGRSSRASDESASQVIPPRALIFIGSITVVANYSIFGLSPDYSPTYLTLVNRVNTGASFGLAFIFVGLFGLVSRLLQKRSLLASTAFVSISATVMLAYFVLVDWGLLRPWLVSWQTQMQVQKNLVKMKERLPQNASILLSNCPRYVMWAPVYDGVWDFQNTARIVLDRGNQNANVISDRLTISQDGLTDTSYGYVCGRYPFDGLHVMVAPGEELIKTPDGKSFVDAVDKRGRQFGIDDGVIARWRNESAK